MLPVGLRYSKFCCYWWCVCKQTVLTVPYTVGGNKQGYAMIHYTKLPLSRYYDRITLTGLACTASNIRKVRIFFPGKGWGCP